MRVKKGGPTSARAGRSATDLLTGRRSTLRDLFAEVDHTAALERHRIALESDATLYAHAAAWCRASYARTDLCEAMASTLALSDDARHRTIAKTLIEDLPAPSLARMVEHLKRARGRLPRLIRGAVIGRLRRLEQEPAELDRRSVTERRALKYLYATLHIRPSERADALLFKRRPPRGTLAWAVRQLALAESPAEQARLIVSHDIPYAQAVGPLRAVTPSVLMALVDSMSPAEVERNLDSLRERGALSDARIAAVIDAKLTLARADANGATARRTPDVDEAFVRRVLATPLPSAVAG